MRAGDIKFPIAFQTATFASNTDGDPDKSWSTTFTRRGGCKPLVGRELVNANAIAADVTHQVTVRRSASQPITPGMRAIFRGRTFDISAALNLNEGDIEMQLLCKEVP